MSNAAPCWTPHPAVPTGPTWLVVCSGVVALAVAMGIGRFAFTPLMPLMLRDGTLNASVGAEWAAANYIGYLLGALTAARFSADPRRGLQVALFGVALTTLAAAWAGGTTHTLLGALMRGAAGVFSAWALVCTSSWALAELAQRQVPQLGACIYMGVGLGIAARGPACLARRAAARPMAVARGGVARRCRRGVREHESARWWQHGSERTLRPLRRSPPPDARPQRHAPSVLCYGTFGFGYIVPATFLPAMARQQVSDPLVFGLTWPLFGLAAALSVVAAARYLSAWPRRRVWALAQGDMALGTALPLATQTVWALAAAPCWSAARSWSRRWPDCSWRASSFPPTRRRCWPA